MASPNFDPFTGDPNATPPIAPYRPSVNDFGGAQFVNSARRPPIPGQQPSCDDFNTLTKVVRTVAAFAPVLVVEIHYASTTPSVYAFKCANENLILADFTLSETGAGDLTIAWPVGTLVPKTFSPYAHGVDGTITGWKAIAATHTGLPAVRVTNGAAARYGFLVFVDGE